MTNVSVKCLLAALVLIAGSTARSATPEESYLAARDGYIQAVENEPPPYADEDFARDVQKAVRAGDAAWLADHARYPVKIFGKKTLLIKTKKAFVANASRILGPKLKTAVLAQDPEKLFRNYQGVMIGQIQNIWFYNFSEGDGKNDFKIITINNN